MGIKLDMKKAYDRLEWDFLAGVLEKLGFCRKWIAPIMACLSSVSFSMVLNGKNGSFFKPSQGLHQGDPISPYLFILVIDVLSHLITTDCRDGCLQGIKLCNGSPLLSHLFFADDSLLFLKATASNCQRMSYLLNIYCVASKQEINFSKSNIFFSPNVPVPLKVQLCSILKVREDVYPGKYIGLPTVWGRSKREALGYIKERVLKVIHGWSRKTLTFAGKEILIKVVSTAIPSYPMSCFLLPLSLCHDIEMALANFWWGEYDNGNKMH